MYIIKFLGGLITMIGEIIVIGAAITAASAVYNKFKKNTSGDEVLHDTVRLGKSIGKSVSNAAKSVYQDIEDRIRSKPPKDN